MNNSSYRLGRGGWKNEWCSVLQAVLGVDGRKNNKSNILQAWERKKRRSSSRRGEWRSAVTS